MPDIQLKVTGKSDIGAISRGLKSVEKDYKSIERIVNKGASSGGKVTQSEVAGLKILSQRYQAGVSEISKYRSAEIQAIRELKNARKQADADDRSAIDKQIRVRTKLVEKLQQEYNTTERLAKLQQEVASYQVTSSRKSGVASGVQSGLGGMMGFGKQALAMAGVFGISHMIMDAYGKAVAREIAISDLGMRMGGSKPNFAGLKSSISSTGVRYGYNGLDSMQALNMYSSTAGKVGNGDQAAIMGLSRAYGLDLGQESSILGRAGATGAFKSGNLNEFVNALAAAIEDGRMQERAVEAQESTVSLLENAVSIMPRLSSEVVDGIISLQTQLNKSGAQGLMGQKGASVIEKLAQLFVNPSNRSFLYQSWVSQGGNPHDYSGFREKMEEGATLENLNMLSKYLDVYTRDADPNSAKLMKQLFFESNGLTFHQFNELNSATNGFKNFGTVGASTDVVGNRVSAWEGSTGAEVQKVDAKYEEALSEAGSGLIAPFNTLKDKAGELIQGFTNFTSWLDGFLEKYGVKGALGGLVNGTTAAIAAGALGLVAGKSLLKAGGKGAASLVGNLFNGGKGKVVGGILSEVADEAVGGAGKVILDSSGNVLSKVATKGAAGVASSGVGGMLSGVGKVAAKGLKGLPIVGAIAGGALDFGINRMTDSQEPMARSIVRAIASTLGGLGGGALGTMALPGVGTVAGGIAGGVGGDWAGGKIYHLLTGYTEDSKGEVRYFRTDAVQKLSEFSKDGTITLKNLDSQGVDHIMELEKQGVLHISAFNADGTAEIKDLTETGASELLKMHTEGVAQLEGFTTEGIRLLNLLLSNTSTQVSGRDVNPLPGDNIDLVAGSAFNPFGTDWKDRIGSRFGEISALRNYEPHSGLDVDGTQGDVLRAMFGGKVIDKSANELAGNYITIEDALSGIRYSYSHLSKYGGKVGGGELGVGDTVAPGSILGYMGGDADTPGKYGPGRSTGSHLHITTRTYNPDTGEWELTDPEKILEQLPTNPVSSKLDMSAPYASQVREVDLKRPHWELNKKGGILGLGQTSYAKLMETGEEYQYKNGQLKVGDTWMDMEDFIQKYYRAPDPKDNKWLHRYDGATFAPAQDQGGGGIYSDKTVPAGGKLTIEVQVTDTKGTLNSATYDSLKNMVQQMIQAAQMQQILNNPYVKTP